MQKFDSKIPMNMSIINRRQSQPNRLISNDIKTQVVLDDVQKYHQFTVEENGYYNIFNQLCIKCKNNNEIHYLQMGICAEDYNDYGRLFNSYIINTNCEKNHVLSNNLTSFKYLEKDKIYILWCCLDATKNSDFEIVGEFSKFQ